MIDKIHKSWHEIMPKLYEEPLITLNRKVLPNISYYPKKEDIFNVFQMPLDKVKVVLIGQDPYPSPGDAIGLSFVNGTSKIPASLRVIYKELEQEGFKDCNISNWFKQGVFLLNTALTVQAGEAGSHLSFWRPFTEEVIKLLSIKHPCIWILWGKKAQELRSYIYNPYVFTDMNMKMIEDLPVVGNYNFILEAPHPAAEAYAGGNAGFYGCNHFQKVNAILKKQKHNEIVW